MVSKLTVLKVALVVAPVAAGLLLSAVGILPASATVCGKCNLQW